ncbi:LysR family transcriptional regulator [Falsiroseomonas sp. HW251]|uniref:LysR family transcriptional regulator n=1 Tax=Falsiroseomonas sp. HW251 TaxID=3390998 RepID=UPI003D31082C
MPHRTLSGLSLRDLEYAVAVAECGHFGRAAERCGVSQAGLSVQIRKLEALLGVPLFHRTTRRLVVSAEGEVLLRQARAVVSAAHDLLRLSPRRRGSTADPRAAAAPPPAARPAGPAAPR